MRRRSRPLLDDSAACLHDALKGQARTDLTTAAQRFELVQRNLLAKNPIIQMLGLKGQANFLRISSGNFIT